jgi:3-oxoacyl-[acyl-carrier protein] reductase
VDLGLTGKVALVTGASRGLGKTICLMLAEEGAAVGVNYRARREDADAVVREIAERFGTPAAAVCGDVSREDEVAAMFDQLQQQLGLVDVLVNNAAMCPVVPTAQLDVEDFNRTLEVNMSGTFLASREMVRRLLAAGQGRTGRIVNISSQAAFRGSQSGKTAYDASKAGIIGFTISLAREMAPHGIHVNCVAPGLMYTEMVARAIDADPERFNRRVPLGRIGRTEEIAAVVVFLCSERASYMTGATVDVSGGLAMH